MQLCNFTDQRNIIDFVGGNFVGGNVELFQKVHGCEVKGRRKAFHAELMSLFHELRLPFPGGIGLLVKVIFGDAVPQSAFIHETVIVAVDRQGVGGIGLQLDGIRTGFGSRVDDFHSTVIILIVVGRNLCHNKGGRSGADGTLSDLDRMIHGKSFL